LIELHSYRIISIISILELIYGEKENVMPSEGNNINYKDFIPEFMERIQTITDKHLDDYNIHQAFVYFIADLFETTNQDRFEYTDGAKDGGIDFFIQDTRTYSIYQCKCPASENIGSDSSPISFDKAPIQELITAITMLRDDQGEYDVKPPVSRLRSDYQRDLRTDPEEAILTATLAIFGYLTPAAMNLFNAEKERLRKQGILLNLISWENTYEKLHELDTPENVSMRIELSFEDLEKEVLRHHNYCYILAYAKDFYNAWRKYEWNLFDWNIRLQLTKSQINKRITASLSKPKSQKIFHHLNNGITITCNNYTIDKARKKIRLEGPQIINGCQTVSSIRDAYESLTPSGQEGFQKRTRVQVKIIKTTDNEFISQMVITTNDQNPMRPRNLKSNSTEQKEIQSQFRSLNQKWFYQRKDGEWKSLLSSGRRISWFRSSDYYVSSKRYRFIDNEKLAKAWYSWVGNSEKALKGGFNYFEDDDVYNRVFRSSPNTLFWEEFSSNSYFNPDERHFVPGIPSIYQYLLALSVFKFINIKRVSWRLNRESAVKRGVEQGSLRYDDNSQRMISNKVEIDEFLASDTNYRLNIMINNMNDILVELFSFLLSNKYGELSPSLCKKTLATDELSSFSKSHFHLEKMPREEQDGKQILGPLYAFIKHSIKQYYFKNKAEISAAPRLKAYLFQRRVVHRLKETLLSTNHEISDFVQPWKRENKPFLDTLPKLK